MLAGQLTTVPASTALDAFRSVTFRSVTQSPHPDQQTPTAAAVVAAHSVAETSAAVAVPLAEADVEAAQTSAVVAAAVVAWPLEIQVPCGLTAITETAFLSSAGLRHPARRSSRPPSTGCNSG